MPLCPSPRQYNERRANSTEPAGQHARDTAAAAAARYVPSGRRGRISGRVARSRDPEMTGNDLPFDTAEADRLYGPTVRR